MIRCRLCRHSARKSFEARVLNRFQVSYFLCGHCKLLQTEEPHWLRQAYAQTWNPSDTGVLQRNIALSRWTAGILFLCFSPAGKYLDYAGGCGLFTRLMRDIGFDYYWQDPYAQNIFAQGFEQGGGSAFDLVTSFESFEHFVNPLEELTKILELSDSVLFSTQLRPEEVPSPDSWWYYGFEHGQHLSFYRMETLRYLADACGLKLHSNGRDLHLLTRRRVNDRVFRLIPKLVRGGLFAYVRFRMKSRTLQDMFSLRDHRQDDA